MTIANFEIGFDGQYKLGHWTPVRVTIVSKDPLTGTIKITLPDGDAVATTISSDEETLQLRAGETMSVTTYAKLGRAGGPIQVRIVAEQQLLASRTFYPGGIGVEGELPAPLPSTARLFVVVGGDIGLADALSRSTTDPNLAMHVAHVADVRSLPDDAIGWQGVNQVVLLTSDASIYTSSGIDEKLTALNEWMQLGGRVCQFVGINSQQLSAPGGLLAEFVPGQIDGTAPLRHPRAIETFCDSRYSFGVVAGAFRVTVPTLSETEGRVLLNAGGNLPLIIEQPRGLGELMFVGFDIDQPPLDDWSGRPEFLRRIFGVSEDVASKSTSTGGGVTSLGYSDLAGQMRSALDSFSGVQTASFAWVIAMALAYLALLGPLDYLIVHRLLNRPALTWITLPVILIATSLGAYSVACSTKGNAIRINQVELVDCYNRTGLMRGTMWCQVYSPRHERFDLRFVPLVDPAVAQARGVAPNIRVLSFDWFGLPGDGLGGLQSTEDSVISDGYQVGAQDDQIDELPIPQWSSKSLQATWTAQCNDLIASALADDGNLMLRGKLTSNLPHDLIDARLYYKNRVYPLGNVAKGQTMDLQKTPSSVLSRNYLLRRTQFDQPAVYNPAARDPKRILQLMMWYELAGGGDYTGLSHAYFGQLDFSGTLDASLAVLVGEAAGTASRLHDDGQPLRDEDGNHLLMYRVLLDVAEPSGQ